MYIRLHNTKQELHFGKHENVRLSTDTGKLHWCPSTRLITKTTWLSSTFQSDCITNRRSFYYDPQRPLHSVSVFGTPGMAGC